MKSSVSKKNFPAASLQPRIPARTVLFSMPRDGSKLASQAERIRSLRALKRVSQQEAAVAIGVSIRAYAAWELGQSDLHADNLRLLAEYYGTSEDFIEYGRDRSKHETPDISGVLDIGAEILGRLVRLETSLADLAASLDELRLLQAELAARDAEVLARIEALQQTTQAIRRAQQQ